MPASTGISHNLINIGWTSLHRGYWWEATAQPCCHQFYMWNWLISALPYNSFVLCSWGFPPPSQRAFSPQDIRLTWHLRQNNVGCFAFQRLSHLCEPQSPRGHSLLGTCHSSAVCCVSLEANTSLHPVKWIQCPEDKVRTSKFLPSQRSLPPCSAFSGSHTTSTHDNRLHHHGKCQQVHFISDKTEVQKLEWLGNDGAHSRVHDPYIIPSTAQDGSKMNTVSPACLSW